MATIPSSSSLVATRDYYGSSWLLVQQQLLWKCQVYPPPPQDAVPHPQLQASRDRPWPLVDQLPFRDVHPSIHDHSVGVY
ncbi:hypothetical protein U0070_000568 [Myodes glareolus]|uniref:Uncharacterized protein n=1 Tax=Myodes glareolus TaxID=447135 RepID=A0AAW0IIS1_MYOGA